LHLNVFFTPSEIIPGETVATVTEADDIYIVIDVIRATTTMAVMFDQGAARVFAAETIEQAREAAQKFPERLLCGERNVQRVPGFDYGNSPVQFSQLDLSGREMIHTTTNGTRAFYACPEHSTRLAGCLYNAEAVASRALALAKERGSNISIVCAGELGYFALDDAVCAGYLALELKRQNAPIHLYESAHAAIALYEAYKPPIVIDHCQSARAVIEGGLAEDVYFCMQTNMSKSVPMVVRRENETGLLVIERV
jgi:2-phosphosulfolactate phosphatase